PQRRTTGTSICSLSHGASIFRVGPEETQAREQAAEVLVKAVKPAHPAVQVDATITGLDLRGKWEGSAIKVATGRTATAA
ncbi:MAG: hypothetical protein WA354_06270, partial [Terracidiphilus sp.]